MQKEKLHYESYSEPKASIMKERENKYHIAHKEKCQDMFNEAFEGGKLYVHIDEGDNEYDRSVRFSIVTEEMLKYDIAIMNNERYPYNGSVIEPEGYRPYFFSFITDYDIKYKMYFEERKNEKNLNFDDGKWYVAWFKSERRYFDDNNVFFGQVQYAASPIKYDDRSIEIIDEAVPADIRDKINKCLSVTHNSEDDFKEKFKKCFSDVVFDYAYIYKAGKANLIRITGHKKKEYISVLFDIGCHVSNPRLLDTKYSDTGKALSLMTPKYVILSHWDADHFMGVVKANDSIYDAQWFAPEIANKSANARRLAKYLQYRKRIMISERKGNERKIMEISDFGLFMGQNRNIDSTPENCGGIALTYKKNGVKSIFCGDVPYRAIENELWGKSRIYDYMIVSHHASDRVKVSGIVEKNPDESYGIICRNERKEPNHIAELKKCNYVALVTEDADLYYKIDLGTKKAPENK